MDLLDLWRWLSEWTRNEMLSALFWIVGGLMIGWLFHKKKFRDLNNRVDDLERKRDQQPTINVVQQIGMRSPSTAEGNAVMSSTITRIESIPQAEYNKLKDEGKADDGVIYLTH